MARHIHSTLHTNEYMQKVNNAVRNAEAGTVKDVLKDIGEQLERGEF